MNVCGLCGAKMVPLFFSVTCTNSKCGVQSDNFHGYIVWRNRPPGSCEYVFKTEADCIKWRDLASLKQFSVVRVASAHAFRWRMSTGTAHDIELSERLHEVYQSPDRQRSNSAVWLDPV